MENQVFVLGPETPCKRCIATREIVERLLKTEFQDQKVTFAHGNMTSSEIIAKYGVLRGPVVVVNDTIISEGEIPKKELILKYLKQLLL